MGTAWLGTSAMAPAVRRHLMTQRLAGWGLGAGGRARGAVGTCGPPLPGVLCLMMILRLTGQGQGGEGRAMDQEGSQGRVDKVGFGQQGLGAGDLKGQLVGPASSRGSMAVDMGAQVVQRWLWQLL